MATKPTRQQAQARDHLVEALALITEAARLDGKASFDAATLGELASRMARASSAFSLDEIVLQALERRGKLLNLRSGTAELLTLFDAGMTPLEMLRISDDEFRALAARMDEELGDA